MTPRNLVTLKEVAARLRCDKATIRRWWRDGRFPEPQFIAGRNVWDEADVLAWEAAQTPRPAARRIVAQGADGKFTGAARG